MYQDDFSTYGKRGAVLPTGPNKVRITIRLDGDIIDHFKQQVHKAGNGNYQTLINDTLRQCMQDIDEQFESKLRKVIREELKRAS